MSIGVAFATGVFKTYNDRVRAQAEAEREAAIKAEEREAGFELATFKADLEEGNIRLRAKLDRQLSDAEYERGEAQRLREQYTTQLKGLSDDQKLILFQDKEWLKGYNKAFGTSITPEMAKEMNALANAGDFTTLGKGPNAIRLPFEVDTGEDKSVFAGVDRMELYLAENPNFIDTLNKDPKTKEVVTTYLSTLYNNYNAFWHNKFSQVDADGKFSSHAYRDWSKGLQKFHNVAKQLGIIDQDVFNMPPADLQNDEIFVPQSGDDMSIRGSVVNADDFATQHGTSAENLTLLSSHHKMPRGASQIYSNIDYLTYGEDAEAPFSRLMADEDKMRSIALGSALLAIGAKDIMLLEGGASTTVLNASVETLNKAGRGDPELNYADEDVGAMRRAYFVITKPDSTFASQPPNHLTGVSGVKYATDQGHDVKGFREQNAATDESVKMLRELVRLQEEYGATGLVAKGEAFLLGIVGQGKQLAELFGSNEPAYDEFNQYLKDGTDAGMLMKTAEKVLKLSRIEQLSKMDALRLTLAAKMARAVDPSGRLSNQDFEIQLQRLGDSQWFSDQKGVLTKLNTVLEEFERRQTSNRDLLSILNKDNITVEDRRFIRATNAVNTVLAHRRKTQVRAETAADTENVVSKPEMELVPIPGADGFFTKKGQNDEVYDANGQVVTDAFYEKFYPGLNSDESDQGK